MENREKLCGNHGNIAVATFSDMFRIWRQYLKKTFGPISYWVENVSAWQSVIVIEFRFAILPKWYWNTWSWKVMENRLECSVLTLLMALQNNSYSNCVWANKWLVNVSWKSDINPSLIHLMYWCLLWDWLLVTFNCCYIFAYFSTDTCRCINWLYVTVVVFTK